MIYYKTKEEIELMRHSNLLVGKAIAELAKLLRPGITTLYLDSVAEKTLQIEEAFFVWLTASQKAADKTSKNSRQTRAAEGIPPN